MIRYFSSAKSNELRDLWKIYGGGLGRLELLPQYHSSPPFRLDDNMVKNLKRRSKAQWISISYLSTSPRSKRKR
jgi:hypothetical protein